MKEEQIKELIAPTLLFALAIAFLSVVLTHYFRNPVVEDPIDHQTRLNTAKNRRGKRTTINHFAANSVNIYKTIPPNEDDLESVHNLNDSVEIIGSSTPQRVLGVAEEVKQQPSIPPWFISDAALAGIIYFSSSAEPTRRVTRIFSPAELTESIYEWIESEQSPFEVPEDLELRLMREVEGEGSKNLQRWRESTIEQTPELCGASVLVEFVEDAWDGY